MTEAQSHVSNAGDSREKLIFLLPSLAGGGAERVAAMLLPVLSDHFQLTLALLEDRLAYAVPSGANKICFSSQLRNTTAHLAHIPQHLLALVRLVKQFGARVVLSFMEQANILNVFASALTGHKAVLSQRIVPQLQHSSKGMLGRVILEGSKHSYRKAAHVVAVSDQIRSILLHDYGLRPNRVTFIPNPVDLSTVRQAPPLNPALVLPDQYILNVGRLNMAQKGQDILLKAFHRLKDRWPALNLILVGEGPDRREIQQLILEMGLMGRVWLTGWQDNAASWMRRAEMLVLASRYEGWPNALVEAMACGCPVIAADCDSGPREIIGNNEYGILVSVNSVEHLAQVMEGLLKDACWRDSLRQNALKRAQDFSLERIGQRYVEVIMNALEQHITPLNPRGLCRSS